MNTVSKANKKVANFYNKVNLLYAALLNPFFNKGRRIVAKRINSTSIHSVLELGCNEGIIIKFLNDEIEYTGIDIANKVIDKAILTTNKQRKLPHVFKVEDIQNTSLKSNSQDSVLLLYTLSVTDDSE